MTSLSGKIVLVTGGTGSIGKVAVRRALEEGAAEVRVLSRSEQKHVEIRKISPKIRSFLGDVRDYDRVYDAARGVDFIFHAAAMKHVPECERDPSEAIKTNVLGSENVLRAAELRRVESVVMLSTDKAVFPESVMGLTKSLMEKLALNVERAVRVCVVRFGNVLGTEGSVLPLWRGQISRGEPVTITAGSMRRFVMTPKQAVDLVLEAYSSGSNGDLFIHRAPVATVDSMVRAVMEIHQVRKNPIIELGARKGEKYDESLTTDEEMLRAELRGQFIVISQRKASVTNPYPAVNTQSEPLIDLDSLVDLIRTVKES